MQVDRMNENRNKIFDVRIVHFSLTTKQKRGDPHLELLVRRLFVVDMLQAVVAGGSVVKYTAFKPEGLIFDRNNEGLTYGFSNSVKLHGFRCPHFDLSVITATVGVRYTRPISVRVELSRGGRAVRLIDGPALRRRPRPR
ncbi:hypothetical protein EVAR_93742_1 [Eumeta japonica]|uniref:Uncharacterized protein n=1 Tax=Eumeta variegata TaxID=151549 RepID=A0A4C1U2Y6_EUMVA|nr:hypothetical protein EVAR_93742_1 [Eumeta japonica]